MYRREGLIRGVFFVFSPRRLRRPSDKDNIILSYLASRNTADFSPVGVVSSLPSTSSCVCVSSPLPLVHLRRTSDPKADMNEEERKARDQQLRSSIHTKLIESGEYDR